MNKLIGIQTLISALCILLLFSCNYKSSKYPNNFEVQHNCSSEKLEQMGVDLNGEKIYDRRFGKFHHKNIQMQRISFKNYSKLNMNWIIFEVIRDNKISYLIDTTGVKYSILNDDNLYQLKGCFSSDLNDIFDMSWEETLRFLAVFHASFGEGNIYRKSIRKLGTETITIHKDSIPLPKEMSWISRKVLLIPFGYDTYRLYCIENQNYEVSIYHIKPYNTKKIYTM